MVALATSSDGSQVAAAREDGSLEVWLVSLGASSWHCQLVRPLVFSIPNLNIFESIRFVISNFFFFGFIFYRLSMEIQKQESRTLRGLELVLKVLLRLGCFLRASMAQFQSGILLT